MHSLKIPAIETYLSVMERLNDEIKKLDKRLKEEEKKFKEVKLLKSIPGISTFSALVILAEIGDVNRWSTNYSNICIQTGHSTNS